MYVRLVQRHTEASKENRRYIIRIAHKERKTRIQLLDIIVIRLNVVASTTTTKQIATISNTSLISNGGC
jgi:hypothetical protein